MLSGEFRFRSLIVATVVLIGGVTLAATYYGTVEEVASDTNEITVKLNGKAGGVKKFTVPMEAQVLIDGKKSGLADVEAGQSVTIIADASNNASRLTLKNVKAAGTKGTKAGGRSPAAAGANAGEWPQHRGPNRDNVSMEKGLLDKWPAAGPKPAWKQSGLGMGYSSVAISDGKVFTMGTTGSDEVLAAMNAVTGKQLWGARVGRVRKDGTGDGPRGTPTVDQDRVYTLGANGDLLCAKADKGNVVWQKNILEEFGGENITWGISESVLIDGDNLICSPGGKRGTMVALNKLTGKTVWASQVEGAPQAAYSSPIIVKDVGEKQYVTYVHTSVIGVRASDGKPLWKQNASANGTANCSTPLHTGNKVFTASGYGTGCALFELGSDGEGTLVYSNKEMVNHHGGMVLLDGYVYGFDEAVLKCIDLATGKTKWQNRSVGKGSVTSADGHLYLRSENGPVALCAATPDGYEETGRFEQPNRSDKPAWSHPVVCGGKLYLRDQDTLLVYDIKK